MSLKLRSLGYPAVGLNSIGVVITGISNPGLGLPRIATFQAGHNQKSGDRIHISGVTGGTDANGIWTLAFTGANTATLVGNSSNNVAAGGTILTSLVFDVTPMQEGHSAVAVVGGLITAGTIEVEGHDGTESSAGVLDTSKWVKASVTSDATVLPNTPGGSSVEIKIYRFMRLRVASALTGQATVNVLA